MGKRLLMIMLAVSGFMTLATGFDVAQGAVVTLKNGKTVSGEVIVQNEDVVIVKTAEGARFQYPAAEVVSVKEDGESETTENGDAETEEKKQMTGRRTSLMVALSGGGTFIPQEANGGHIGGEFMIGSRYIGQKTIFLGGGIGVHGLFAGGKSYTFLPLQVAVKVPFIEGKHSPYAGASVGYGFGVSKGCTGGIFTEAEAGYRYAFSPRSSLLVALRAQFQQATIDAVDTIIDEGVTAEYVNRTGRSFVTFGVLLGITF